MRVVCPFRLPDDDLSSICDSLTNRVEKLKNKKILLTGGTGFIGKWLTGSFISLNREFDLKSELTIVSRDPVAFTQQYSGITAHPCISFVEADLCNEFDHGSQSFDYVIHGAEDVANRKGSSLDQIIGTVKNIENVVKAVKDCDTKFLLLSSGAVYGDLISGQRPWRETDAGLISPNLKESAYTSGKRFAETLVSAAAMSSPTFQFSIARLFTFVGPHLPLDTHFAIGNFIRNALNGETIKLNGDGRAVRSYMYASDLCEWLWTILLCGNPGSIFNVGGSSSITIRKLAELVADRAGTELQLPEINASTDQSTRNFYVPNTDLAQNNLSLSERVDITTAVEKTIKWIEAI